MAYSKMKTSSYKNLSGIDVKVSEHVTKTTECLDLVNLTGFIPGSWVSRPGSNQAYTLSATFASMYNDSTSAVQFSVFTTPTACILEHFSEYLPAGGSNAIFSIIGASTLVYDAGAGATVIPVWSETIYKQNVTNGYAGPIQPLQFAGGSGYAFFSRTGGTACQNLRHWSSAQYNDAWYINNRYDNILGANTQDMGYMFFGGTLYAMGGPGTQDGKAVGATGSGGGTGTVKYAIGYANRFGFNLPIRNSDNTITSYNLSASGKSDVAFESISAPDSVEKYGLSYYVLYRNDWDTSWYIRATYAISATTWVDSLGTMPFVGVPANNYIEPFSGLYGGFFAKYFKIHKEAMFYLNILPTSYTLNIQYFNKCSVWFSDQSAQNPIALLPEQRFDIENSDGDEITGAISWSDRFLIFKSRSVFEYVGADLQNAALYKRTGQYGCLRDETIVEVQGAVLFLDEKGIVKYSGSGFDLISWRVQPIMDRLNTTNAKNTACAGHNKPRGEVWFSFPVDNSETNNMTVVYNYQNDAWSRIDGIYPTMYQNMFKDEPNRHMYFGKTSPYYARLSASLFNDEGAGITYLVKTRFHHEINQSTSKMHRRLYVDTSNTGMTQVVSVGVFLDHSLTASSHYTLPIVGTQGRLDFGEAGKGIAYEISAFSASFPITIYGYTNEYRFLRGV